MATWICAGGHILIVMDSKTSAGSDAMPAPKITTLGTIFGVFLFLQVMGYVSQ